MNDAIRILVVDDNRLLREGLVSMLEEQEGISVVGSAPSGDEALERIKDLRPNVVLMDIGMPGKDGIEVTQVLHREAPEIKVIILGMIDSTGEIMACIEAGAVGYAFKETSFEHLTETIRLAHRGESICSPQMAASLFSRIAELAGERVLSFAPDDVRLTPRELEIINAVSQGLSNKEVGLALHIETQTVKNHIHNILEKLQLHSRLEAVEYARQRNLLKKK